jgi:hypothetical protein
VQSIVTPAAPSSVPALEGLARRAIMRVRLLTLRLCERVEPRGEG